MQQIKKCNICGGTLKRKLNLGFRDIVGITADYTQHIEICSECGFIFTGNPFDEEQLSNRYKNFSKFEYDNKKHHESSAWYIAQSLRQQNFIYRYLGSEKDNIKSVFEVGATTGGNLSIYKDCEVYGVEPSEFNCATAREKYHIDMFCGVFAEFMEQKPDKKYNLVFLSHVLEHIVNPMDFIKQLADLNDGYMYIEVPTFDYKFINEPYGMFCEEHVNMFTLHCLEVMMQKCGYTLKGAEMLFEVEQIMPAGWPALSTLWKKSEPHKIHEIAIDSEMVLDSYLKKSKQELTRIEGIISEIPDDKRLAIWGTGHHASMLLANTSLGNKNIVAVFDSDEKKWGMRMAGCEIEPFQPEIIGQKNIEVILLPTYVAQRAIQSAIKKYQVRIPVVVLYDL